MKKAFILFVIIGILSNFHAHAQLNKTDIYWHLSPEGMETQVGVLEAEQKNNGIRGVIVLDLFNNNFCSDASKYDSQMKLWTDRFNKAVFNNNQSKNFPIKEAILSIRANFFCDMTKIQIDSSKCEYKKLNPVGYKNTCVFATRHMPLDLALYESRLDKFFTYLDSLKISQKCTIDLWGEPNAPRFWWGTYNDFVTLTTIKVRVCKKHNLKMLMCHATTSGIVNPALYGGNYTKFMDTTSYYNDPMIGYSTSLYKNASKGMIYNYDTNYFPKRNFSRTVLAECGWATGLVNNSTNPVNIAKWEYFNSKKMMTYFVDLLKYSKKVNSSTICLFILCDNFEKDGRGILAFWKHLDGGGYIQNPPWFVYRDFMTVIKDGWIATPTGIKGTTKEIVLTSDGYIIK